MPTKLNKAGNQQNYVPAGNGDASGEYGDNATGSNKHFTNFAKPTNEGGTQVVTNAKQETSVTQEQPPQETPKAEEKPQIQARTNELTKKQIREIGDYVQGRDLSNPDILKRTIHSLRYYGGSFGDLSKFTDEELKNICLDLQGAEESADFVWYKEGSKWKGTKKVGLLDKAGIKHYTREEKAEQQKVDNEKLIASSQNETDKEIQKIFGDNCVCCFGKGYNKEDLHQVLEDVKTYTNEFPELKGHIELIGDRNNLEKLVNAIRAQQEPTEEAIQQRMKELKRYSLFSTGNDESKLREWAIQDLQSPIRLSKLSNALAYWSPSEKALIYMGKMKKRDDEDAERSYNANWHSSNKVNGTFCHEMGHAIDDAISTKYKNIMKNLEQEGKTNLEKIQETYDKKRKLELEYYKFKNEVEYLSNQNYNKNYTEQFNKTMSEKLGRPYSSNAYGRDVYDAKQETEEELKKKGIKKYNVSEYATTNIKEFVAESFSACYSGMNNELANKVVKLYKDFSSKLKEFK